MAIFAIEFLLSKFRIATTLAGFPQLPLDYRQTILRNMPPPCRGDIR